MSADQPQFAKLLDLARTPSSEKRRELLREVTDLFFQTEPQRSNRETELFDEVLRAVASDMQEGGLEELAHRLADAPNPPLNLVKDLARRAPAVADPILRRSNALQDEDLIDVVATRSQDHIRAVADRARVSLVVSDAIVAHGDDRALDTLIRNDGANISRKAMETVVDRAKANSALHEGVVGRADMPLDLLNEMYFEVEQKLRKLVLDRNAAVDPKDLEAALAKTRSKIKRAHAEASDDLRRAQKLINDKKQAGELTGPLLVQLYRDKQINAFLFGLSELTHIDYETSRQIVARKDLDALAMLCRSVNLERALFVTLAVLCVGGKNGMAQAEQYGRLYTSVPVEAAQRAMRFYAVRKADLTRASAAA